MKKQILRRPVEPSTLDTDMSPLLQRIYAARHVDNTDALDLSLKALVPANKLGGLDSALDLLQQALAEKQRILIVGDFDADGATSCALTVRALRAFGAAHVDYLVPDRFKFGYGLTPEIVAVARERNPDLIVTVDNGVASIDGVAAAKAAGIRTLITDHHLPGDTLPDADAIVNPNLRDDKFPSKNLAGVGVIFYILGALRSRLREHGWFEQQGIADPSMANWLDLVALGTVADVVTLDSNNRRLVEQGLRRIRAGACVPGILALLDAGNRNFRDLVSSDLGFCVAPRLNAAGRLDDMSLGIECLLADSPDAARQMARQLDSLNSERRNIEADMQAQALQALETLQLSEDLPPGLCLFDPDWHQGVIGILASRIKERVNRPVIAFARTDEGEIKGSARSIQGFHIRDALDAVATGNPGLITRFGGHAMAAGLSLPEERLQDFMRAFAEEAGRCLTESDFEDRIWSDGELEQGELNLAVAEELRSAGPWGAGFPEPVFDGHFRVEQERVVGQKHLKLVLLAPGDVRIDAIAFNQPSEDWIFPDAEVRAAFRLDVNEFRGRRSAQLIVEYLEPAENSGPTL